MTNSELFAKVAALEGWRFDSFSGEFYTYSPPDGPSLDISAEDMCFRLIEKYKLDIICEINDTWHVEYWLNDRSDASYVENECLKRAVFMARLELGE